MYECMSVLCMCINWSHDHIIQPPFLCFIILLSPMLKYSCKLCVVKHSILDRSLSIHLVHFIISKPVSNGGQQLPQSVFMDQSYILFIKTAEGILDNIFRVSALESFSEEGQKHGEVDWARSFVHH